MSRSRDPEEAKRSAAQAPRVDEARQKSARHHREAADIEDQASDLYASFGEDDAAERHRQSAVRHRHAAEEDEA